MKQKSFGHALFRRRFGHVPAWGLSEKDGIRRGHNAAFWGRGNGGLFLEKQLNIKAGSVPRLGNLRGRPVKGTPGKWEGEGTSYGEPLGKNFPERNLLRSVGPMI